MRLTDDERRAMVEEAIHEVDRQRFAVELQLVANRDNPSVDIEALEQKHLACIRAVAGLEKEYAAYGSAPVYDLHGLVR